MRRIEGGAGPGRETLQNCIPVWARGVTDGLTGHSLEDFHLGAAVRTSDGYHAGTLQRMVVDGESWDPHALIVLETEWFSGRVLAPGSGLLVSEVIVPLDAVAGVTADEVRLNLDKRATRALPPYLSFQYAPLQPGDQWRYAAALFGGAAGAFPRIDAVRNKAESEIEISRGERVMIGHTGNVLGTVQDVLFDEGELVGIVVRPKGLFKHDLLVQVRFLDRGDDLVLFVRMTAEDVTKLAEYARSQAP
jgi:sporulation protein YlmC with PRC-barrel domain